MKEQRRTQIIAEAQYVKVSGASLRKAAKSLGISKSKLHKDLREGLMKIGEIELFYDVDIILRLNKAVRHLRGGEATRQKYLQKKKE